MKQQSKVEQIQRSIILVLAVLVLFVFTGSVTLAIYTRFEQDSATITFGPPVAVYISDDENNQTFSSADEIAYPGTIVNVNLWFGMEFPSSEAYIRTQFNVGTSVDSTGTELEGGLIEFTNDDNDGDGYPDSRPNPNNWVLMDFNFIDETGGTEGGPDGLPDDPTQSDIWYVFATKTAVLDSITGQPTGAYYYQANPISNNGDTDNQLIYKFIQGQVTIGKSLTNEYANSELSISFSINAIQTNNYTVPISDTTSETYYLADYYNDGTPQRVYIYDSESYKRPNPQSI